MRSHGPLSLRLPLVSHSLKSPCSPWSPDLNWLLFPFGFKFLFFFQLLLKAVQPSLLLCSWGLSFIKRFLCSIISSPLLGYHLEEKPICLKVILPYFIVFLPSICSVLVGFIIQTIYYHFLKWHEKKYSQRCHNNCLQENARDVANTKKGGILWSKKALALGFESFPREVKQSIPETRVIVRWPRDVG